MKVFFFDTETTWTNNKVDKIIQFWGIFWEFNEDSYDFVEIDRINQFINVDVEIPEWATAIHWIRNEDLVNYWYIDEYINSFLSYIEKADFVVGHNVEFDRWMLEWEAKRLWINFNFNNVVWVDTMKPSSELVNWIWWRWPKLQKLHEFLFWYAFDNAHDAMADIEATKNCFIELVKKYDFYENWKFKNKIINNNEHSVTTYEKSIYTELANSQWKHNKEALEVLDILNKWKKSIFLTWKAWTWKSTLIKWIIWVNIENNKCPIVLGSTWISALNIWWQTIHSFFWLWRSEVYFKDIWKVRNLKLKQGKIRKLREAPFIIIDEVSMVHSNTLDIVDSLMRLALKNDSPFWWKQMLFVWDIYQLPPVRKENRFSLFWDYYKSERFFHSEVFKALQYEVIELTYNYRQKEDTALSNILDHIRDESVNEEDIYQLNLCKNHIADDDTIVLYSHNMDVDLYNQEQLDKLEWPEYILSPDSSWDYPDTLKPFKDDIVIKEWAKVMMLTNDQAMRWVNGSIWTITRIEWDVEYPNIYVNIDWMEYEVDKYTRKNAPLVFDEKKWVFEEEILWTYTQYPFKLAYAITIHKSQWLTFDHCKMDIWKVFVWWQAYTALSRVRSLNWLTLTWTVSKDKLFFDPRIKEFKINMEVAREWKRLYQKLPSPTLLDEYTRASYDWWFFININCFWFEDKIELILSKFTASIREDFKEKFWYSVKFFFDKDLPVEIEDNEINIGDKQSTNLQFEVCIAWLYYNYLNLSMARLITWSIPSWEIKIYQNKTSWPWFDEKSIRFWEYSKIFNNNELLQDLSCIEDDFNWLRKWKIKSDWPWEFNKFINIDPIIFEYRNNDLRILFQLSEISDWYIIKHKKEKLSKSTINWSFKVGFIPKVFYSTYESILSINNISTSSSIEKWFSDDKNLNSLLDVAIYVETVLQKYVENDMLNWLWENL